MRIDVVQEPLEGFALQSINDGKAILQIAYIRPLK
jgi:hypothetical protein